MMLSKPRLVAIGLVLSGLAALLIWQELRMRRLAAELATARAHVEASRSIHESNERLSAELGEARQQTEAARRELKRHEALTVRMRQTELENARLHAERETAKRRVQPETKPPVPPKEEPIEETAEWKLVHSRMMYSKILGLCVLMYASDHQGQVPSTWAEAIASMRQDEVLERLTDSRLPPDASLQLQAGEIEMVYRGRVGETGREPGTTILARAKQAVQLTDGRWAKAYVFDDGHGEIMAANTLEELAVREAGLMAASGPKSTP